jgi:hypothetical protein
VNAAAHCDEVDACESRLYPDDEIDQLPPCRSVPTDHCEGNVAKQCKEDEGAFYEVSYDCSLVQATCVEGVRREGVAELPGGNNSAWRPLRIGKPLLASTIAAAPVSETFGAADRCIIDRDIAATSTPC